MQWANDPGKTVEILRINDSDGELLWHLSIATIIEDGLFSMTVDIERNLTLLSGRLV